jgi:hypothetical protein
MGPIESMPSDKCICKTRRLLIVIKKYNCIRISSRLKNNNNNEKLFLNSCQNFLLK